MATKDISKGLENPDLEKVETNNVGQVQELRRNFSLFSVIGISFSLANSWFGISTALTTGINAGGPVQLVYGTIIIGIVCLCIGASLAELASAMPDAGGQYYWTSQLASPKYARFTSYLTGWIAWAGSLFTCASIALGVGNLCMGCIQMAHPTLEIKPWMSFVAYQVVNIACALFNTYSKILPGLTLFTLWSSIVSFLVIILTVSCKASAHRSAGWVFTTFINRTGWNSNSIAFIVGLVNPNWAFNGLDCATHIAEEAKNPERAVPIAILGTVGIGFATAWLFGIAMMFSIQDFDSISSTPTGVPILELFHQSLNNKAGAIVLLSLIIVTGCGCLIASHTWQARLCWSFARDNGLPCSSFLATIHPKAHVPINAHIVSSVIVAILGCIYLASYTAFNSMVTACIVLLYLSYSIPVLCLWLHGRSKLQRGPFWLGRIGWVCNGVLFGWFLFALVMYSFPPVYPVTADDMNYVSVVYIVVCTIIVTWWYASARKNYSVAHITTHHV